MGILVLCASKFLLAIMNSYLAKVLSSDCDYVPVCNLPGMDGTGGGSSSIGGDGGGSGISSNIIKEVDIKMVDTNIITSVHSVSDECDETDGGGESASRNNDFHDRILVLGQSSNNFAYYWCQVPAAGYLFLIITRVCITRRKLAMAGIFIMFSFKFITWIMNYYLSILLSDDGTSLGRLGSDESVDPLSDREKSGNLKDDIIMYENVTSDSEDDDGSGVGGAEDTIEQLEQTTPELFFREDLTSGGTPLSATARGCGKDGHEHEDKTRSGAIRGRKTNVGNSSRNLSARDGDNMQESPSEDKIEHAASDTADVSAVKNDPTMSVPVVDPSATGYTDQPGIDSTNVGGGKKEGALNIPSIDVDENDEEGIERQRIVHLRNEGRTFYINGAYRDSVICYTDAIRLQTLQINMSKNDAILAALYGNRAAALLMVGAYEGASADCERALLSLEADSSNKYESLESGPAFRSKILCRMARALLNSGNVGDAEKAFNNSIQSAKGALAIVGHQSRPGMRGRTTTASDGEMQCLEKILNKTISDATIGLLDVKEYRDAIECANDMEMSEGFIPGTDQKVDVQLLMSINSALSISPGSIELHERKVNVLASLNRWAELANHCERFAAESVKFDGLFSDDLASLNPFPDVRPAHSLKGDFFEKNPHGLMTKLSPKAVCEAVIRLPNGILPTYLRSLRLEERFVESERATTSLEAHMNRTKFRGNRGNISITWLSTERDKLRRTMSWKEMGDILFRDGDYEKAAEKYAQCLTIDNGTTINMSSLVNENAGGRLHAVLHCNRAACLMTLKKYREAVKECTAALRIHTHYMTAMLRRGRCFARIRQYGEAIAEYERYIQLVIEARKSPQTETSSIAACTFDRPMDITEAEYINARKELIEVKKSMQNAASQYQEVADLRDEGRVSYLDGAYLDSVICYTEAIRLRTSHLLDPATDKILAALYDNRAAALIMTGAYEVASADCDRAMALVDPNFHTAHECLESGHALRSKISCRMARALLKSGKVSDAEKAFNRCIQIATEAIGTVMCQSQPGSNEMRDIEKILIKRISDAKLGLSDIQTYKAAVQSAQTGEKSTDQLLLSLNSALLIAPGSIELHERKVNALASLKRWAELANHCERLAAESVKLDGLFSDDLSSLNPFPDVRPAHSLKADFFEKNQDDVLDPAITRILSPKAVCEAVVRMPNGILPLYLRALRLEERFAGADMAVSSIEAHMTETEHRGNSGNMSASLLSSEKDKLLRTKSLKEMGDQLFSNGDYERAGEKYAQCLGIDNNTTTYSTFFVNENAGGRLHAVLHCNRAACLMAINRHREAVKECSAALRIHTYYMKAILRRGRCFAKILKYEKSIAEYERYIQLVTEARKSPQNASKSSAACTFDRPIDVTDAEYNKAKQELVDVKKSMRNTDEEREQPYRQQQRRHDHQYQQQQQQQQQQQHHHQQQHHYKNYYQQYHSHQHNWYQYHSQHHYRQQQQQQQQQQQEEQPRFTPTETSDHYQVLGLLPTATATEIKKAYHKCALKYHPDKNSEENAAEMFRRAKLAYDVLGNEQSRVAYDSRR